MKYYLGIDIGTSSSKAVAFAENGDVLTSSSVAYSMQHPRPGQSEQDPNELFDAVIKVIQETVAALAPELPLFVAFSSAMHSLIAVDQTGNLLTQCIIWADNRANAIAEALRETEEGMAFYHATGVPVHSMSPMCKLLWLKETNSLVYKSAFKFIGIKEYVFYKLFGVFVVDTSIASATGLLNCASLEWDDAILKKLELSAERLSKLVPATEIFLYDNGAAHLQFPETVPFVIGASDGALSNFGTGAVNDILAITIGTSGAARIMVNKPFTDSSMRTFCYHLKNNQYIAGGANNNGAVVLQWLKENILKATDTYVAMFDQVATVEAGSEGLLFLPYILGERAPIWNSIAKGVYYGLTINHKQPHLIRATIEAVVYSMYSIAEILMEKHPIGSIHASGGFAKSAVWLQIVADVFNKKVIVSGAIEAAALGAVMLGAEAMKTGAVFEHRIIAEYLPGQANNAIYQKSFRQFKRLYELLKTEMVAQL